MKASCKSALNTPPPAVYSTDRSKAVVPVLVLLIVALWFVVYSTRRIVLCLTLCHFVLVFFNPFSIAITSLGKERANLSAFVTFVRFVLVWICRFSLPLGVWEGLQFVIVALPGLFSYLFFINTNENGVSLKATLLHCYKSPRRLTRWQYKFAPSLCSSVRPTTCSGHISCFVRPRLTWFRAYIRLNIFHIWLVTYQT